MTCGKSQSDLIISMVFEVGHHCKKVLDDPRTLYYEIQVIQHLS